jgi:hypothetical protein
MKKLAPILLLLFLSDCGPVQQAERQKVELITNDIVVHCKEIGFRKMKDEAQCMNDAWTDYIAATNDPNADIILLVNTQRLKMAKLVDAHKIRKDDAETEFAEYASLQIARMRARHISTMTLETADRVSREDAIVLRPHTPNCLDSLYSINCPSH